MTEVARFEEIADDSLGDAQVPAGVVAEIDHERLDPGFEQVDQVFLEQSRRLIGEHVELDEADAVIDDSTRHQRIDHFGCSQREICFDAVAPNHDCRRLAEEIPGVQVQ